MVAVALIAARLETVSVVPLAVVKPSHVVVVFVPVAFTHVRFVMVEVALLTRMPPESVASPVAERVVKAPVEAFVAPMVVPLMVPPEIVAFDEVRLMMLPVVPEAVVKPSQVDVAFVAVRLNTVSVVPEAVVKPSHVVVVFVPVAFTQVRLVIVEVALFTRIPPLNVFNPDQVFVSPNRVDDEPTQPIHVPTVRLFSRRLVPVAYKNPNHLVDVTLITFSVVPLAVVKPSQVEVAFVAVRLYTVSVVPLAAV